MVTRRPKLKLNRPRLVEVVACMHACGPSPAAGPLTQTGAVPGRRGTVALSGSLRQALAAWLGVGH
jgi:hypothetical protein